MKALGFLLITLSLQFTSGCTLNYTPSPSRPFERINEFSSTSAVTLQNAQPSTEQVEVYGRLYANYNAWTDVAITIAERELTKRGMRVIKDAKRTLTMSIISAHTEVGWANIATRIAMEVKTSDGYSATFTGINSSGFVAMLQRQIDGALMRVVVAMLKDQRIVSFLTTEPAP